MKAALSKGPHTIRWVLIVAVLIAAAALRLTDLDARPLHGDESLNTTKFNSLWTTGRYEYDPHEYHGPTLPYATLPVIAAGGARDYTQMTEGHFRWVTALCGVALVGLTLCVVPALGWTAGILAATLTALSTAMVFYSRYYIHEMPLVLASWLTILCGWRYLKAPSWRWAAALGAGVALMHATKETALLAWCAMGAGAVVVGWIHRDKVVLNRRLAAHAALALAAMATVNVALFSAFFTHARGPLDSLLTFAYYAGRGTGGEPLHLHPWYWYFHRLLYYREAANGPWFSEALIVIAALVGVAYVLKGVASRTSPRAAVPVHPLALFIAVYTVALAAAYCIIPYKTPWCMLGFLHGMTLLAGFGVDRLWRQAGDLRIVTIVVLLVSMVHLARQTHRANFTHLRAHPVNPYVYAHTNANIREISDRVEALAKTAAREGFKVLIVNEDQNLWPLPYYLRRVSGVAWSAAPPAVHDEDVLIVVSDRSEQMHDLLHDRYAGPHTFGIRPGVVVAMYVKAELWNRFMDSRLP